jgi:hypothetical protein
MYINRSFLVPHRAVASSSPLETSNMLPSLGLPAHRRFPASLRITASRPACARRASSPPLLVTGAAHRLLFPPPFQSRSAQKSHPAQLDMAAPPSSSSRNSRQANATILVVLLLRQWLLLSLLLLFCFLRP